MAYTRPGVFIEEILSPDQAQQGVSTSVGAFLGITKKGPANRPILVSSLNDFIRVFGGPLADEPLYYSVRSFFENGGSSAYIVRVFSAASSASFANTVLQNQAVTPADLLKIEAGYRGEGSYGPAGKDLSIKIRLSTNFVSQYVAATTDDVLQDAQIGDLSLIVKSVNGIQEGAILKITEAVSGTPVENFVVVSSVASTVVGGSVQHQINLSAPLTADITAADSKIEVLEYDLEVLDVNQDVVETWSALSLNPLADNYIETIINDSEIGSIHIRVEDLLPSASIGLDKEIADPPLAASLVQLSSNGEDETTGLVSADIIGTESAMTGIQSLSAKDSVNLLCIPPSLTGGSISSSMLPEIQVAMLEYCGSRMDMFAILDTPADLSIADSGSGSIGEYRKNTLGVDNYWGALYYPHVVVKSDDGKKDITLPCSGSVAGLYSRVDSIDPPQGGVSSAPAGFGEFGLLRGLVGLEKAISESKHGDLNSIGVNCLRRVNRADGLNAGVVVLGARTLSSKVDFTYLNVRRFMTFIEQSIKQLARPFLFRNNGPQLWGELSSQFESFLSRLFRSGQLAGSTQDQAFYVKIDSSLNTPDQIQRGLLIGEIGVATLKPAEFMVFRFSQTSTGTQIEE